MHKGPCKDPKQLRTQTFSDCFNWVDNLVYIRLQRDKSLWIDTWLTTIITFLVGFWTFPTSVIWVTLEVASGGSPFVLKTEINPTKQCYVKKYDLYLIWHVNARFFFLINHRQNCRGNCICDCIQSSILLCITKFTVTSFRAGPPRLALSWVLDQRIERFRLGLWLHRLHRRICRRIRARWFKNGPNLKQVILILPNKGWW